MSETARIARLLEQTFDGEPYHGPSVLSAIAGVTAEVAASKPLSSGHCIWDLVAHLTAELNYACTVIEGTAEPWIAGETTWPAIADTSDAAWYTAVNSLKKANGGLVRAVKRLHDDVLDQTAIRVGGLFYLMLHGTIHHNIYHAGQILLLRGQKRGADP